MKNKDIHEWLLDEGIDPLTTVTTEKGEYYLSDIIEKHLTEQLRQHLVSCSPISEEKKMEFILIKFHGHTREQWQGELMKKYPFSEIPYLVEMVWNEAQKAASNPK